MAGALVKTFARVPQPVTKYCITIPIRFDTTQKSPSPLGTIRVNMANINGIIQTMVLLIDCCLRSAEGTVDIFCKTHIDAPHRMARMKYVSGTPRFSQRNFASRGTVCCIIGRE